MGAGGTKATRLHASTSYGVLGRWREPYDSADTDRADQLLDALGVRGLGGRSFGTLSEGERKRTMIARARTKEELAEVARIKGYAPGWIYNMMKARQRRSA